MGTDEVRYHRLSGSGNRTSGGPVTLQDGAVALDKLLQDIWQNADGRTLEEIIAAYPADTVRHLGHDPTATGFNGVLALACLAEAGLLARTHYVRRNDADLTDKEKTRLPGDASQAFASVGDGELVSTVIVSYNSMEWLPDCLKS